METKKKKIQIKEKYSRDSKDFINLNSTMTIKMATCASTHRKRTRTSVTEDAAHTSLRQNKVVVHGMWILATCMFQFPFVAQVRGNVSLVAWNLLCDLRGTYKYKKKDELVKNEQNLAMQNREGNKSYGQKDLFYLHTGVWRLRLGVRQRARLDVHS